MKNQSIILTEKPQKYQHPSSGKIDNYKCLIGEEILPSDQGRVIEEAKLTYSPLENVLGKQRKTIEDQGEKQIKAIKNRVKKNLLETDQILNASLFSKHFINKEAMYEINKMEEMENKLDRNDLIYRAGYKKKDKVFDLSEEKFITMIYNQRMDLNNK